MRKLWRVFENEETKPGAAAPEAAPEAAPAGKPAADPASVVLLNAEGQPLENAADRQIVFPNASATLAGSAVQHLTTFVAGLPMGNIEAVADFLSPRVDAGLQYEFEAEPDANQLLVVGEDVVGFNGLPVVIALDPRSKTSGRLQFRGAELPYPHTDQLLDASTPGMSVARGEERRVRWLNGAIARGRLQRVIALAAANTSASDIDFSSDNDPIKAMQTEITTLAAANNCDPSWVRVLIGSTAWLNLIQHAYLTGGANYARQAVTKAMIAALLEIPEKNLMVSYVQAITSKQGKSATKAVILGATTMYFFIQPPEGFGEEDPGWAKTFAMRLNGQYLYAYRNTTHAGLNVCNVGLAYYEDMKCTSSAAIAQRTASTV